jgi:hypothetical protein
MASRLELTAPAEQIQVSFAWRSTARNCTGGIDTVVSLAIAILKCRPFEGGNAAVLDRNLL